MNRIYRLIWSDKSGTFVAVAEIVKSGKKSSGGSVVGSGGSRFALKGLAVSLMLAFASNAYALPNGGSVTAGGAIITSTGTSTTISQSTANAAINWQSFSIGQGEAVQFVQPNSSSITLNRVLGPDPSSILGNLSANGKVFLLNPNGILFGQGAQVNVGGLVATTLTLSDSDFMAGRYQFSGAGSGAILNQGSINADGGYVALLGAQVSNEGVISARLGTVALAAGKAITLDLAGDELLNVTVNQGAVNALVQNGGLIQADGGQVLLTAMAAGSLLQSAVNNTGVIQAQSIENHNGTIRLLGDMQSGTVNVGGKLDVSGMGTGQTGGSVTVTGQHIGLFGGNINASGDAGGGTVMIGGGYQGKTPSIQNASATYMSDESGITADAITNGNGGEVVIWSNDSTRAYGSISARGGLQGGDGGLIETSGHWLDVAGININASAPQGKGGTWLLDPADVTITGAVTSGGSFSGGDPDVFSPASGESTANVNLTTITTALNLGTDVTITTVNSGTSGSGNGDINVDAVVTWSVTAPTSPSTLTLDAVRDINVNSAITATRGSFVANAGRDVNVKAVITTTDGNIILRADKDGTGPGVGGGIVAFTGAGSVTMTRGAASIYYNPSSYATPTNYLGNFSLTDSTLNSYMWVFAQGSNRVYDGTMDAIVNSLAPDLSAALPSITLTTVNALFDDKNVGTDKPITFDSYTLTGPAGYALYTPLGVPVGSGVTTASITPLALTGSLAAGSSVYGAALAPGAMSFSNIVGTDDVTPDTVVVNTAGLLSTSGHLTAGPHAGIESVSTTLAGADAGNYTFAGATANYTVSQLALLISATGINKVYDGLTTATASLADNRVTGDLFATAYGTASYLDKNVGNGKTVNIGGITLTGADAGNYTFNTNASTTANITPAPLGIAANSASRLYGAANPAFSATYSGFQNGETAAALAGALALNTSAVVTSNVGSYAIAPSGQSSTNYTISYVDGTLGITAAPLGITANPATKTYDGLAFNGGNGVTYAGFQGADNAASLSGTLAYGGTSQGAVNKGSYAIVPSGQSSTNYTISYINGTLGITAAPLGITANSASKTYGSTVSFTGSEFISTGLMNGETVGNVSLASAGAVSTATVAGSPYPITASAATGGTFNPNNYTISYANGFLGVVSEGLAITANPATKIYDGLAFNGGNGVTYAGFLGADNAASLGGTLTYGGTSQGAVNAGNFTIIPSGQTSSNYTITYINGTLGVIPAPLGITANSASKIYGSTASFTGSEFISTGLKNGETMSSVSLASAGAVASANVASYSITPSNATGGNFNPVNYTISYIDGALGVIPAPLGITANPATKTYDGLAFNGGNGVTYVGFQVADNAASLSGTPAYGGTSQGAINAGNYAIVPSGQSSTNYTISYTDGTLGVIPAPLGITANSASKIYGSTVSFTGNEFISTGLKNGETMSSVSLASAGAVASANVASYSITPSSATGGNFNPANYTINYIDGTLGITAAPLGITANPAIKTYDGLAFNGGNGVTYTGFQGADNAASLGGTLTYGGTSQGAVNAGSYAIVPSGQSSTNYTISYTDGTLGVIRAPLGITANNASKTYGSTANFTGSEFISTGLKNGETMSSVSLASAGAVASANVASYLITPSNATGGNFNPANYTISYIDGALGVIPAPLSITANPATKTYDGLAFNGGNGVTYVGFQVADNAASLSGTPAYGGTSQGAINAGSYAIIPSGQSSTNYTISYIDGTLGITAAPLGITANSASKTYGSTVSFTGTEFSSTGLQNSETIGSVSLASAGAASTADVAGSPYAITASAANGGNFNPANYTISYVDGTLSVISAPLGITANSATRLYGAANPAFSATYSGFENGETAATLTGTLILTTPAVATSNVGNYAITPSGQSSTNYTISYLDGALSVTPASLGVTANNATRPYGAANPAFTATYTGFRNEENSATLTGTLAFTTPAMATSNVGDYVISPSGQSSTNYTISYLDGVLGVVPSALTIRADDASKVFGQTPILSGFTSIGLVNGETIGRVTETSPGTNPGASVSGSPYVITPSNATGGTFTPTNYIIDYDNSGKLFVTPLIVPPVMTPVLMPLVAPEPQLPLVVVLADPQPQQLSVSPPVEPIVVPAPVAPAPIAVPAPVEPKPIVVPAPVDPLPVIVPQESALKPFVPVLRSPKADRN